MELSRKRIAIIVVVGLVVLAAIVIPVAYFAAQEEEEEDSEGDSQTQDRLNRVDCYPDASSPAVTLTKEKCEERGCKFDAEAAADATLGVACYYQAEGGLRYSMESRESTGQGLRFHLKPSGPAPFPEPFRKPVLDVVMVSNSVLRFTFDDKYASPPRYRVPFPFNHLPTTGANKPEYHFKVTDESKFAFTITRNSTGKVIFDTGVGGLVLTDQFLQLAAMLPSTDVYGMGEQTHPTFRRQFDSTNSWPAFARDQFPGQSNTNLYGVHPFYTCVEDAEGNSHGVFLLNSNAQEYTFSPGPMLTWRTIGGVLDFFVIVGSDPENVVNQYLEMVGRPVMPPYWALGFQLCRYGYNNLTNLQRAVDETQAYDIPLDVQYADIDHMDERKIFTVDQVNFGGLSKYFDTLRAHGMRTIIILDPCIISNETDYKPYDEIKRVKGSVMWPPGFEVPANSSDDTGAILGYVWPKGKVVFLDFFKNVTQQVWEDLILEHRSNISFDGLWIDMNEPASFGTNEEKPFNWPDDAKPYWSLYCGNNKWDEPPYRPLAAYLHDEENLKKPLADKTICMNTVQGDRNEYRHYDVHSLYGWSQTLPTLRAARAATGERSMVITRSTFPGSGRYAGHWLGDNFSKWSHLKDSIIGMLDFNLFGIPYVGADICGFNGDTTEELCLRWMQLGAFYPFSRNHNIEGAKEQHPGAFGDKVGTASREIMEIRYWLLPYLYTLFHYAHTEGKTVVRPLHHEFPKDKLALGIDQQFLWGPALLISPILEKGQTELKYYLPSGLWYDFYTGQLYTGPVNNKEQVNLMSKPALHLRGGHIVILQAPANTTYFSRQNMFEIRALLDKADTDGGVASGTLFWDDGMTTDTYESGNYSLIKYEVKDQKLHVAVTGNFGNSNLYYGSVIIYGVTQIKDVLVITSSNVFNPRYSFNETSQILNVTLNETSSLSDSFTISWGDRDKTDGRMDCFPDARSKAVLLSRKACEQRGCRFDELSAPLKDGSFSCYYPFTGGLRYFVKRQETTANGMRFHMMFTGTSPFGGDFKSHPMLDVFMLSDELLRFTFYEMHENPPRFRVPLHLNLPSSGAKNPLYVFNMVNSSTIAFTVTRKATGTVIFDTGVGGLVLTDQFLQLATRLPSTNVYGLGEHSRSTFKRQFDSVNSWPAFARDQPPGGDSNLYGVHPFYTCMEDSGGNSHGVFLLNSNAQEYALGPGPVLTWRTIGGVLDFFIFMGPNPENVVQQYTQLVGRPMMPPYWSLGFQLCRYGYNNLTNMQKAVEETKSYNIPQDVQYADIDHMDERKIFTVDEENFGGLSDYFDTLRAGGMRTIIILDPCVLRTVIGDMNATDFEPYEPYEAMKRVKGNVMWPADFDVPANSSDDDGSLLGYVWPSGKVVFPDFFKNATQEVWKDLIVKHHKNLTFDGLWIDMNEPANFGTNLDKPWNWPNDKEPWSLYCANNKWDEPPYRPLAAYYYDGRDRQNPLADKTLCMNALQGEQGEYRHYDVHSLYGWSQTLPTLRALRAATGERGVVISRSTFPGSGRHSGHWLGDNTSSWKHLADSIIGMLDFNLFGIPYIGADICGFFQNTTEELCLRWMQLGAFYPFSRNHNGVNYNEQNPGAFGDRVGTASREILETRYWLLPYLYTLFYNAHTQGYTVVRPLHHEFKTDSRALDIDRQFLWGAALLISPILEQNQTELEFYLPRGRWYQFYTGEMSTGPANKTVTVDLMSKPELHLRGGHVVVLQEPANNTHFSRQNPLEIRVMLDPERIPAWGSLFWDDGVSIDTTGSGNYIEVVYVATNMSLQAHAAHNSFAGASSLHYERVIVYGVTSASNVTVAMATGGNTYTPAFDVVNGVLNVTLDATVNKLSEDFEITWQ